MFTIFDTAFWEMKLDYMKIEISQSVQSKVTSKNYGIE